MFQACALLAAVESLLLHGGGGGGGQLHAEVSNPMEFTVFSTPADCSCVLVFRADPCWNVSICRGFCASRSEQQGFACFQKAFFSGRSNPMVFTFLCTPVDCSCALCIKSRKAWFLRCVGWFSGGNFCPPGHLSSAALFSRPASASYFVSVGWAGGGGLCAEQTNKVLRTVQTCIQHNCIQI